MKDDYSDILKLSSKTPEWYDVHGVPRFSILKDLKDIRNIKCQECRRIFKVKLTDCYETYREDEKDIPSDWSYGDPPYHMNPEDPATPCVGNTMNSIQDYRFSYRI